MPETDYQYQPLTNTDSTRLIEVQPSSDPAADIQRSLIHTRVTSDDRREVCSYYTALTYVWRFSGKM
jgi:hypothetical protein